ncbi:MAG: hypothetical protein ACKO37_09030 [Vampirovibrionales bacterium]
MINLIRPSSIDPRSFEKPKPEIVKITGPGYADDAGVIGTPRTLQLGPNETITGTPFGAIDPDTWLGREGKPGVSSQQILNATTPGKEGIMPNPETGRAIFFTNGQPGVSARVKQSGLIEQEVPFNKEPEEPIQ